MRTRAPLVGGIGATLVLSGSVMWIIGNVQQGTASATPQNSVELQSTWRISQQNQLGGMALTLVGLCTVGIAAAMWSWEPARTGGVSASVLLVPNGGGVSLAGTFP